ncbi:hypothetical protein [Pedobacter sp. R-06]|uniref:hypothetical protein n=1 Tax=Pedobacter sp. R-06 TaxID=3404051 RepID=UPI003CEF9332
MDKTESEIDLLIKENQRHIERLNKMILNLHSVANIRFWYWSLGNFSKSSNIHKDLMNMDALTTSIVISYGRLFAGGNGSIKLKDDIIPDSFKLVHDAIIDLRNQKYAHHGGHRSIESVIKIEYIDSTLSIFPTMNLDICFGAPKEWASLFEWLDNFMYANIDKQLFFLTRKTGIEWKIPHGDAPEWVV